MHGHQIFLTVSGVVYLGLATSLSVALVSLPLVALLLTGDPAATWLPLAVLATLAGPAFTAAFAVFRAYTDDGSTTVARTFFRAWVSGFGKSAAIAGLTSVTVTVLSVDVSVLWGQRLGAVAIPVLVTAAVIALATGLTALVVASEARTARLRDVLKAALFIGIRRCYAPVLSLAALAVLGALVARAPALGLGLGTAPALYLLWATSRHAIHAVLHQPQPGAQPS